MNLEDAYKATVVSLYPIDIREEKSGLIPNRFFIPKSVNMEPSVCIVSECRHYVYIDVDRGQMEVRDPAIQVAESIVRDFINSTICVDEECSPGLLAVPGVYTGIEFKLKFAKEYESLKAKQLRWYRELIKMADNDWQQTHRHNSISQLQRLAAGFLNYKSEWVSVSTNVPHYNCPVCTSVIPQAAIVCPNCHQVLNKEALAAWEVGKLTEVRA